MAKLTDPQRELLTALAAGDVVIHMPWGYELKRTGDRVHIATMMAAHMRGWIRCPPHHYYEITDAGRLAYEQAMKERDGQTK